MDSYGGFHQWLFFPVFLMVVSEVSWKFGGPPPNHPVDNGIGHDRNPQFNTGTSGTNTGTQLFVGNYWRWRMMILTPSATASSSQETTVAHASYATTALPKNGNVEWDKTLSFQLCSSRKNIPVESLWDFFLKFVQLRFVLSGPGVIPTQLFFSNCRFVEVPSYWPPSWIVLMVVLKKNPKKKQQIWGLSTYFFVLQKPIFLVASYGKYFPHDIHIYIYYTAYICIYNIFHMVVLC